MNTVVRHQSSATHRVSDALGAFTYWLEAYGEKSWDFQSFFAGRLGGYAKALYYRRRIIGTAAVAPMIFCEAFLPSGRRLFHHPLRFPIADAHYAMGFAFLYEATGEPAHLKRAIHFLNELKKSRCQQFKEYCWGYPFDWVWRGGTSSGKHRSSLLRLTLMKRFFKSRSCLIRADDQRSDGSDPENSSSKL